MDDILGLSHMLDSAPPQTRGIGRGLTRHLLFSQHRIFLIDYDDNELQHAAGLLSQSHTRGEHFDTALCNLRNASEIRDAAYTGGICGLSLEQMTLEEWNKSVETDLTGPILMTQASLGILSAARGSVINMSSTRAGMSEPGMRCLAGDEGPTGSEIMLAAFFSANAPTVAPG